jgi:uncharacterized protein
MHLGAAPWPPVPVRCRRETAEIPMRDGVRLVADLYHPDTEQARPVIAERTPYGAGALAPLGECYAARGYCFAAVDVRGRYRSEGVWEPLRDEENDSFDTLAWLLRHPRCDGRLGTRGHSYSASNQFFAAPQLARNIRAMVSHAGPGDAFENVPFHGGAYDLDDLLWAWTQTGPTSLDEDPDTEQLATIREMLQLRPLIEADVRLGLRVPHIREWMRHWRYDDYWHQRSWTSRISAMHDAIPTMHVSGWWDTNGRGSVLGYAAFGGRGQRLVIGPWDHGMQAPDLSALPGPEQALVHRAALREVFNDELQWFDRHLAGDAHQPPGAEVFLTGAWGWAELDAWPLHPPRTAFCLGVDGSLSPGRKVPCGRREYVFDPRNPTPASCPGSPWDLAPYDTSGDARSDVLIYRSAPLPGERLVLGDAHAELFASTTARDTDWVVRLCDEYPDGRSIYIRDGVLRARFRNGFACPVPVRSAAVERYQVDLWHLGHLFRKGHRIRVEIASSARWRWDVNPGDGGDLATSTAEVVATQNIWHGGTTPSTVFLPVVGDEERRELLSAE